MHNNNVSENTTCQGGARDTPNALPQRQILKTRHNYRAKTYPAVGINGLNITCTDPRNRQQLGKNFFKKSHKAGYSFYKAKTDKITQRPRIHRGDQSKEESQETMG